MHKKKERTKGALALKYNQKERGRIPLHRPRMEKGKGKRSLDILHKIPPSAAVEEEGENLLIPRKGEPPSPSPEKD